MTIQEALDIVDEMKPNMMSRKMKIKYLTQIEQLIFSEIVNKHYDGNRPPINPYNEHTDPLEIPPEEDIPQPPEPRSMPRYTEQTDDGTELIIPDPYAMVYVYWLMTKIDMQNQEDARYNIDRAHFENAYETMSDWYTREHMPVQRTREFRL